MHSRVPAVLIAVVLALAATMAMIVYVKSADQRALKGQEPVNVLVAAKPIPHGLRGEDALIRHMVKWVQVPSKSALPNRVLDESQLRNRYADVNVVPGEQLLKDRWVGAEDLGGRQLLTIPEDHQAVSIGVDLVRQVAGFVTPGDKVSVAVTMPVKGLPKTDFVLQDVPVLAVGATALTRSTQGNGGRVNQGKGSQTLTAVTLAVEDRYVRKVIFAAENGSIYLTLLPPEPHQVPGSPADESNLFQGQ